MFCQQFSPSNIEFFGQPRAPISLRKRALSSSRTAITFFMTHPTGSPLSGSIAIVPPFTAANIVTESVPMLQNITGVTVVSVEALITSPNIIFTVFFAQIILPIFITLIVLALVIGVVIIVVIV